ncbi:glycosyltransferase family 4 protein [Mucilaginibacter lacusdianchii]|uniref:glycosyltransferase family 4 protein n=1 Tax=Mucilaginibacter lacusdianchii TaxID=2684211 RepID=UPI00131E356C|nr:glycosyltransferase family 4 protein [Mucilaginibacter sp. JXJ CY 39]
MKPKVIIYGVNYYPPKGGTSRVVENLIIQLKDRYDITIYCYKNALAKQHIEGVNVVQFTPIAPGSLGSLIYFFMSAIHILLFGKADLINAHKTDCALFIPLLRLRFKVMATSHEAPYKRDKWNFIQKMYFKAAEYIFIQVSNVCTCISEPLTHYYQQKYHKDVYFIPNGINPVQPGDYDFAAAQAFIPAGASLHQPFILFSARRLMATKGCHTMLKALNALNYTGQIFISGELNENSSYLKQLKQLAGNLNVFFIGYVEPLPALLALIHSSSLFIFPSETEGMSIMLLEVASVGKPIIASDIPENTQIFSDKEVLYFQNQDVPDLAQKIKYALANPDAMKNFGRLAKQKVYANYLWKTIANRYDDLFLNAINNTNMIKQNIN